MIAQHRQQRFPELPAGTGVLPVKASGVHAPAKCDLPYRQIAGEAKLQQLQPAAGRLALLRGRDGLSFTRLEHQGARPLAVKTPRESRIVRRRFRQNAVALRVRPATGFDPARYVSRDAQQKCAEPPFGRRIHALQHAACTKALDEDILYGVVHGFGKRIAGPAGAQIGAD